jgi:hypothetical protein
MGGNKRYTIVETSRGNSTMAKVVAGNIVRAYKQAVEVLYGDTSFSEVPREINLEVEKIEEKKKQWVEIDG